MIDKRYGRHYPSCDVCGEDLCDDGYDTFQDAKNAMEAEGWIVTNIAPYGQPPEWINTCNICVDND